MLLGRRELRRGEHVRRTRERSRLRTGGRCGRAKLVPRVLDRLQIAGERGGERLEIALDVGRSRIGERLEDRAARSGAPIPNPPRPVPSRPRSSPRGRRIPAQFARPRSSSPSCWWSSAESLVPGCVCPAELGCQGAAATTGGENCDSDDEDCNGESRSHRILLRQVDCHADTATLFLRNPSWETGECPRSWHLRTSTNGGEIVRIHLVVAPSPSPRQQPRLRWPRAAAYRISARRR